MSSLTTSLIAQAAAEVDKNAFWSTSGGRILQALLFAAGILVVLFAAAKALKDISSGQVGKGVKVIIGAAVIAAFLFVPTLVTSLIDFIAGIIEGLLGSGNEIIDQNDSSTIPSTTTVAGTG